MQESQNTIKMSNNLNSGFTCEVYILKILRLSPFEYNKYNFQRIIITVPVRLFSKFFINIFLMSLFSFHNVKLNELLFTR